MKRISILMVLVNLLVITNSSMAAESKFLNNKAETKQLCEAFMQKVIAGKIEEAINSIEPYFPLPESELATIKVQAVKQFGLVEPRFGKPLGYEFIKEEIIKETIIKYTFIEKFEKHVVKWTFFFYKPQEKWLLNAFYFDDTIQTLFE